MSQERPWYPVMKTVEVPLIRCCSVFAADWCVLFPSHARKFRLFQLCICMPIGGFGNDTISPTSSHRLALHNARGAIAKPTPILRLGCRSTYHLLICAALVAWGCLKVWPEYMPELSYLLRYSSESAWLLADEKSVAACPQTRPISPQLHSALNNQLDRLHKTEAFKLNSYELLGGLIRIP